MDNRTSLHLNRINDGLKKISDFREGNETAFFPEFKAWKERLKQSLSEVFGKEHDYTKRFITLRFWDMRVSMGKPSWSSADQEKFENDLFLAEQLLHDVLEEIDIGTPTTEASHKEKKGNSTPQIVINVTNVLSQTMEVQISQVIESLKDLELSPDQLEQAENHTKDLAAETRGRQRWPIMAKSLDKLKSLGKSVYERVAIPLLLEMLKKQTGL
ncbi:MAG: hypothetical protein BA863_18330 [Desulfovibrio sp. S3730MH75]|nr:MAG: hypothetical protein BA863_18330 [Desulfovibrio sp. S3730MH75]